MRPPCVPRDWQNLRAVGVVRGDAPRLGYRDPAPTLPPGANRGSGISSGPVRSQKEEGRSRGCLQSPGWPPEAPGLGSKRSRCPGRTLCRVQAGGVEGRSSDGAPRGARVTARSVYWLAALAVASVSSVSWAPSSKHLGIHTPHSPIPFVPHCALSLHPALSPPPSLFSSVTPSLTRSPVSLCPQSLSLGLSHTP